MQGLVLFHLGAGTLGPSEDRLHYLLLLGVLVAVDGEDVFVVGRPFGDLEHELGQVSNVDHGNAVLLLAGHRVLQPRALEVFVEAELVVAWDYKTTVEDAGAQYVGLEVGLRDAG